MPLVKFIDNLRLSQILDVEQLDEVARVLQPQHNEPRSLADDLLQRGWLTSYQVDQLLRGQGAPLVLGQYLVLEKLGEGGMGHVFKARHRLMDRVVALKVIRQDLLANPAAIGRFRREIKAAGQLVHPNIVLAYDAAQVGETHFFVMEFVEGIDLGRFIQQRGPMSIGQACSCIRQAALGLQHAHEQNLVHRDIKPSNLLLATRGAVVKLVDMGLARLHDPLATGENHLTAEGALMGTADFMSPEQADDFHAVDVRGDVYALGCTLYYLLAGEVPFPGGNWYQKVRRHKEDEPASLEERRSDVPPELLKVLRQSMAKERGARFQTPGDLAVALEPFARCARPAPVLAAPALMPTPFDAAGVDRALPSTIDPSGNSLLTPQPPRPPTRTVEPPRWIVNHLGMLFVHISEGRFVMGSPTGEEGREEDEWQHEVEITRPVYIGVYPVKQREFLAVMGRNPSFFDAENGGGPDFPVENLSWADAVEFCRRLTSSPREVEAGRTYRLPTEAEWEYVCRAGTTTPFSVGETLSSQQANFDGRNPYGDVEAGDYLRRTSRVGMYPDNPWGVYDLHGNVWEWCSDWYGADYYQTSPLQNPQGPPKGQHHVVRGGSWHYYGNECRSAFRATGSADFRLSIGFRVVLVPDVTASRTRHG